jgi:26S proteasome regulatory subunit N10
LGCLADVGVCRHLVSVPPGPHLLADIIISSPILFDGEAGARGGQAGGEGGEGGDGGDGFDPNMDPELAMVSSVSDCASNAITHRV